MFSFIRYATYLLIILAGLFLLQKNGFDVKRIATNAGGNIKDFFQEVVGDGPVDEIKDIDLNKASSTSTTTPKKVQAPKGQATGSGFSIAGIVEYTNKERVKAGLKPLTINRKLNLAAKAKVDDMFTLQYFEHISPQGESASDLVKKAGYNFELVGENLALGNFGSDQKLVAAWMNSPKHKENILNPRFTEIGIAIANGEYKGDRQWIFVQHFGKAQPNCQKVDSTMKDKIDAEKLALEKEEGELKKMADQIEKNPNQANEKELLEAYNTRVAGYNNRLTALKELVEIYNNQVSQYNTCRAQG